MTRATAIAATANMRNLMPRSAPIFVGTGATALAALSTDGAVSVCPSAASTTPAASLPQFEQRATPAKMVLPHHLQFVYSIWVISEIRWASRLADIVLW